MASNERKLRVTAKVPEKEKKDTKSVPLKKTIPKPAVDPKKLKNTDPKSLLKPSVDSQKKVKNDTKISLATKAVPPDRIKAKQPLKPEAHKTTSVIPRVVRQPTKAAPVPDFKTALINLKKPIPSTRKLVKGNKTVMDRTHNVTVMSPPSIRRADHPPAATDDVNLNSSETKTKSGHERSLTRTLEPHEVTQLNSMESLSFMENSVSNDMGSLVINMVEKAPVSFEVNFDDHKISGKPAVIGTKASTNAVHSIEDVNNSEKIENKNIRTIKNEDASASNEAIKIEHLTVPGKKKEESSADESYDEDFESYESDFESGSSSQPEKSDLDESTKSSKSNSADENESGSHSDTDDNQFNENNEIDHESEATTETKSTVQKNNYKSSEAPRPTAENSDYDKGFVSGNYEAMLSIPSSNSTSAKVQLDSVDSGIECISDAVRQSRQRAHDILQKVTMDVMSFSLFEMKPINYNRYMDLFGELNTAQIPTQTNDGRIDVDCQTDAVKSIHSVSTQYPATFSWDNDVSHTESVGADAIENIFDKSLQCVGKIATKKKNISMKVAPKNEHDQSGKLAKFLEAAAITVSHVLQQNTGDKYANSQVSHFDFCENLFQLDLDSYHHIPGMNVSFVYANEHVKDLFVTVIKKRDNVANYLYLWSWLDLSKPLRLLSSWTTVTCVEIHSHLTNIILAGSQNGSIAFWDINEPIHYHPIIDNKRILIASQICVPNARETRSTEYGRVTAIKSWGSNYGYQGKLPAEVCCLYEAGWIAIWTLIETIPFNELQSERSPWSRFQLIQRELVDISFHTVKLIPSETRFHQIRQNFEMDLFADSALQELNHNPSNKQSTQTKKIGFIVLEVDLQIGAVIVASDHNFILIGTTALKRQSFKRIEFEELIHIQSVKCLYSSKTLLIGLSTGEVRAESYSTGNGISKDKAGADGSTPEQEKVHSTEGSYTSKSCTIQNILKRTDTLLQLEDKSEMDPHNSELSSLTRCKSMESLDFQSGQIVLHGFFNLMPSSHGLLYSKNLKRIVSLDGSMVRTFDVAQNMQINKQSLDDAITSGCILETSTGDEVLVITTTRNVEMHRIRKLLSC